MSEFDRRPGQPDQQLTRRQDLTRDPRSWYNRPHEELVGAFSSYIKGMEQRTKGHWTPEHIVHTKLNEEARSHMFSSNERARGFFDIVAIAFDALAYDRYEPGSETEKSVGVSLNAYTMYESTTVRLTDPLQIKIIDALSDAVGIPHKRGQEEFEIPEQLRGRNFSRWCFSHEYQQRVTQAQAKSRR